MKTSESVMKISEALARAQAKIKHAMKDAKNPHLKTNYATLESVIDASKDQLLENGIIVIQSPTGETLTTRLQHSSGEFIESELRLFISKQDMQGLGAAITYARRYSLAALLNISQTDDDGHSSSSNNSGGKPEDDKSSLPKNEGPISEAQVKRMFAIMNQKKIKNDELKDVVKSLYGKESSKDLKRWEYDELTDQMSKLSRDDFFVWYIETKAGN